MLQEKIRLSSVPFSWLPLFCSNRKATLWVNGNKVKEIYIQRDTYRITTDRGQLRYSLDTDLILEITT